MKTLIPSIATMLLAGAAMAQPAAPAPEPKPLPAPLAVATLVNADKKDVGMANIYEGAGGLVVRLEAKGLPEGWHAFHFHQKGTCDDAGFKQSGDHFAGAHAAHGVLTEGPHAGDLPNVYANRDGAVKADAIAKDVSLKGEHGLLDADGAALILHAKPDDYQSQPSGAAGDRIACGVLKSSKP